MKCQWFGLEQRHRMWKAFTVYVQLQTPRSGGWLTHCVITLLMWSWWGDSPDEFTQFTPNHKLSRKAFVWEHPEARIYISDIFWKNLWFTLVFFCAECQGRSRFFTFVFVREIYVSLENCTHLKYEIRLHNTPLQHQHCKVSTCNSHTDTLLCYLIQKDVFLPPHGLNIHFDMVRNGRLHVLLMCCFPTYPSSCALPTCPCQCQGHIRKIWGFKVPKRRAALVLNI